MSRIIGIDMARWQGVVDFDSLVSAGIQFAYIKACHGLNGLDPRFKDNWAHGRNKLPIGAYLWFTDHDPFQQADRIVSVLDAEGFRGDLPIAVDFEEPGTIYRGAVLLDRLRSCLARIHALTGRAPVLYTGDWYWAGYAQQLDAQDIVETYPLWLAQYPRVELRDRRNCATQPPVLPKPNCPKPWRDRGMLPTFLQFDGDGGCVLPNDVDADFDEYLGDSFEAVCDKQVTVENVPSPQSNPFPLNMASQLNRAAEYEASVKEDESKS